jgi:hypothetical protein
MPFYRRLARHAVRVSSRRWLRTGGTENIFEQNDLLAGCKLRDVGRVRGEDALGCPSKRFCLREASTAAYSTFVGVRRSEMG